MKKEVGTVCFTITGDYMTNQARDFWAERRYGYAVHFLMEGLVGLPLDLAIEVLQGKKKFVGDSNTGLDVEEDNFSYEGIYDVPDNFQDAWKDLVHRGGQEAQNAIVILNELYRQVNKMKFDPHGAARYDDDLSYMAGTIGYYQKKYEAHLAEQDWLEKYGLISTKTDKRILCPWFSERFNTQTIRDFLFRSFDKEEYSEYTGRVKTNSGLGVEQQLEKLKVLMDVNAKTSPKTIEEMVEEVPIEEVEEEEVGTIMTEYGEWFSELQNQVKAKESVEPSKETPITQDCYIAPDGRIIHVGFQGHIGASESIAEEYGISPKGKDLFGIKFNDHQEALIEAGFIQISSSRIFTWTLRKINQAQTDALFDWFYANGEQASFDTDHTDRVRNFADLMNRIKEENKEWE